jgi:hypothetical protein
MNEPLLDEVLQSVRVDEIGRKSGKGKTAKLVYKWQGPCKAGLHLLECGDPAPL